MPTVLNLNDTAFEENGYGSGDGDGSGDGSGSGYGYGYGSGSGYGDGSGDGRDATPFEAAPRVPDQVSP